ncbi:hypothetical protein FPV67DRAFT_1745477 [Lyophyllum atratum]|nr:hypothetical protein FPV67DRAFT_1745477 [Lyophyllum atratum]
MASSKLPFYNHLGEVEYMNPQPFSFGYWSPSTSTVGESTGPSDEQSLVDAVSRALCKSPTESHVRARGSNLTLEIVFDDETRIIARKVLPKDKADEEQGIQKLSSEARLLHWLLRRTDIPVPRILYPAHGQYSDFIVMDKLPSDMLLNVYGTLGTPAKERLVHSFAHFALELFKLDVPQRIGTLVPGAPASDSDSSKDDVVPRIGLQEFRATRVFEDIREYLDFLFEMKKNLSSSSVEGGDEGGGHEYVDELRQHVDGVLAELFESNATMTSQAALLRCVLVHTDLNDMNILADETGQITGVIDWEYQILQPAVLAASYPPWLSYDGCSDPRFANHATTLWMESREESERLRELYLRIVKGADHDYWNALVQGARLRSCVEWLVDNHSDPGCKMMKKWMDATFGGSSE